MRNQSKSVTLSIEKCSLKEPCSFQVYSDNLQNHAAQVSTGQEHDMILNNKIKQITLAGGNI